MNVVRIEALARNTRYLSELQRWFENEWPDYYAGGGPGDAAADLARFARDANALPLGLIALRGDVLCGIAALKRDAFGGLDALCPWASAGLVRPELRGRGIGAQLIAALEGEARRLGHAQIYSATSTAATLLQRCGWHWRQTVVQNGAEVGIYEKRLDVDAHGRMPR